MVFDSISTYIGFFLMINMMRSMAKAGINWRNKKHIRNHQNFIVALHPGFKT
jgi:hypothetical protein